MKRPCIDSVERELARCFPNSLTAALVNLSISVLRFQREIDHVLVPVVEKIETLLNRHGLTPTRPKEEG